MTKIPGKEIANGLYIVSTPIGNLGDITERAKICLAGVDRILCEDTRMTSRLLDYLDIKTKLVAYHDHNGPVMRPKIIAWLEDGERLALVSDAGTPLISDPGYKLVEEVAEQGHKIIPIPGPSAVTAALSIAGLPTDQFLFAGFPPSKQGARQNWLKKFRAIPATLVFYDSPKRIVKTLQDCAEVFGPRRAVVCRELTKKFEEVVRLPLLELADEFAARDQVKGEIVLVIGPPEEEQHGPMEVDLTGLLSDLVDPLGVKAASNIVAKATGISRKAAYDLAEAVKRSRN